MLLRLLTSLMLSSITTTVNFPALLMEPYSGSDPDVGQSIEHMVTSKGYPFERHRVTTEDGYILEMHRIPHGRQACSVPRSRQPVFLMSGFLVASVTFVLNSPHQSLGFVLADHGYDVWLGNVRGNTYGKNHRKFSNASREFWNFSFHEFGAYDGPAQIDHVLKQTKRDSLFYVGLSQGALIYFVMMSERPEYNAKVKAMMGLAPFRKMPNFKVPLLEFIATRGSGFLNGLYSSGAYEVMPRDFLAAKGARALCAFPSGRSVCAFLADFMFNMGHKHTNHVAKLRLIMSSYSENGLVPPHARRQFQSFLLSLDSEDFCLSAAGFFHIKLGILPTIAGAVFTYTLILIQTSLHFGAGCLEQRHRHHAGLVESRRLAPEPDHRSNTWRNTT